MKRARIDSFICACLLLALTQHASASFVSEVYDGKGIGSGRAGVLENNEVEPGMVQTQKWDLEKFELVPGTFRLRTVGGYNFAAGEADSTWGKKGLYPGVVESGDLFIDLGKNGTYDYVIDLDFVGRSHKVIKAGEGEIFATEGVTVPSNQGTSNTWQYKSGGSIVTTGSMTYYYKGASNFGLTDNLGQHYAFEVDLGFLPHNQIFSLHFTMECGNDLTVGEGILTPDPSTFILLGAGLAGLAVAVRKRKS